VPACNDGRTDGQTHDDFIYCASIALRGKIRTNSSAVAEGPRDELYQLKSCK